MLYMKEIEGVSGISVLLYSDGSNGYMVDFTILDNGLSFSPIAVGIVYSTNNTTSEQYASYDLNPIYEFKSIESIVSGNFLNLAVVGDLSAIERLTDVLTFLSNVTCNKQCVADRLNKLEIHLEEHKQKIGIAHNMGLVGVDQKLAVIKSKLINGYSLRLLKDELTLLERRVKNTTFGPIKSLT